MEKSPFLSVIMPIYNTKDYVKQAIESVLTQTFSDFQLILLDDHSTDGSGAICDDYAQKDKRVLTIHLQKNGGVSNARNFGLRYATGKYVTFIDSDDYIDSSLYLSFFKTIEKFHSPEVLLCGIIEEYCNQDKVVYTKKVTVDPCFLDSSLKIRNVMINLERKTLLGYVYNKFYFLDYIRENHILFDQETKINEDFLFNMGVFRNLKTLAVVEDCGYHYLKRGNKSATGQFIPDYFPIHEKRVMMLIKQFEQWDMITAPILGELSRIYVRYVFSAIERNNEQKSHMSHHDKVFWMNHLFKSELYHRLSPYFQTGCDALGVMSFFLKRKQIHACLMTGNVIYFVKKKNPTLFAKVKQKR